MQFRVKDNKGVIKMKIWKSMLIVVIFSSLYLAYAEETAEDGVDGGLTVPICGHINASETQSLIFSVDHSVGSASFILSWDNSSNDMKMVLHSPSGKEINSSVEQPINYQKNDSMIFYIIPGPENGNWTAEIAAAKVPGAGENYCAFFVLEEAGESAFNGTSDLGGEAAGTEECENCSSQ